MLTLPSKKNGLLDPDDEICFMVSDMGDSASADNWIANNESFVHPRYQVAVIDTSQALKPRTYAYIYRSATLDIDLGMVPYMSYVPALNFCTRQWILIPL